MQWRLVARDGVRGAESEVGGDVAGAGHGIGGGRFETLQEAVRRALSASTG